MNHHIKPKIHFVILIAISASIGFLLVNNGNNISLSNAQVSPEINVGNISGMASDTFFQLDDSIQEMKSLINETQSALDDGNTTMVKEYLNQLYRELLQISNNSNNLIWDVSNEGN